MLNYKINFALKQIAAFIAHETSPAIK